MVTCDSTGSMVTLTDPLPSPREAKEVGGVLEVFAIDDEWIVVHAGRDEAEYVTADEGVIGHQHRPRSVSWRG